MSEKMTYNLIKNVKIKNIKKSIIDLFQLKMSQLQKLVSYNNYPYEYSV